MTLTVVEFTDPFCPWAWGSEPTFRRLRHMLGADERPAVEWRRVFGMLFDISDEPAPDPVAETAWYHHHLHEIAQHTGAPVPAVLERVAATSRPASLAAKAAEIQGPAIAERVLRRLREQLFLTGKPPDTPRRVRQTISNIAGLDVARLEADMVSDAVVEALARDYAETFAPVPELADVGGADNQAVSSRAVGSRAVGAGGPHPGGAKEIDGRLRYAFPTLLITGPAGRRVVPGWRPLAEYVDAIRAAAPDQRLGDVDVDGDVDARG